MLSPHPAMTVTRPVRTPLTGRRQPSFGSAAPQSRAFSPTLRITVYPQRGRAACLLFLQGHQLSFEEPTNASSRVVLFIRTVLVAGNGSRRLSLISACQLSQGGQLDLYPDFISTKFRRFQQLNAGTLDPTGNEFWALPEFSHLPQRLYRLISQSSPMHWFLITRNVPIFTRCDETPALKYQPASPQHRSAPDRAA